MTHDDEEKEREGKLGNAVAATVLYYSRKGARY